MKNLFTQTINEQSEVTYGSLLIVILIIAVVFTACILKVKNAKA